MQTLYYIVIDGDQKGPFTKDTLIASGLTPSTLVWRQGMPEWTLASELAELNDLFVEESAFGAYADTSPTEPYFAMIGGSQVGPMQPRELIASGLTKDTPVWRSGMNDWQPAFTQPEIMSVLNSRTNNTPHSNPYYNNAGQYHDHQSHSVNQTPISPAQPKQHTNWLPWAIVATIGGLAFSFIALVVGAFGIYQASKANGFYRNGDEANGDSSNRNAKTLTIIALALVALGLLGTVALYPWLMKTMSLPTSTGLSFF